MPSVFVIITKLIASKNYFCKEFFCNNFVRDGMFLLGGGLWARAIGTICPIGVFCGEMVHFFVPKRVFFGDFALRFQ